MAESDKLLTMYLEDLQEIIPLSRNTEAMILQDVCEKDEQSRNVIINNYFVKVVDWVKAFEGKGMVMMDMVQEANLVVMDELGRRDWMKRLDAFDVMDAVELERWIDLSERLDEYLKNAIGEKIHALLEEDVSEHMVGNKILKKVNAVNDAAAQAKAEYGRNVTVAELAEYMHITEDEVREAMKLSADKIENVVEKVEI